MLTQTLTYSMLLELPKTFLHCHPVMNATEKCLQHNL